MEQNIATGGTSRTRTPILKFLMKNALFDPVNEALHIAHWASAVGPNKVMTNAVRRTNKVNLSLAKLFITGSPLPVPEGLL